MIARRVLFFLLLGVAILGALATGTQVAYFICLVLLAMLVISALSLLLVRLRFTIEQKAEPVQAQAGDSAVLSIMLANPYPFPFPQLEVEYVLPGYDGGLIYVAAFSVMPLQKIRIRENMALPCRGEYGIGLRTMKLYDVFGLFCMKLPYRAIARQEMPKLLVLPRMTRLGPIPLPMMESPVNAAGAALATEDPSSMADVRAYVPGDPVKRIHWKLSARQRQLLVKRYEPAAVSDALIYLDACAVDMDPRESWIADDVLTSAALSLAAKVLELGIPVELIHRDERRRRNRLAALEELPRLRRELARLDLDGPCPLGELLAGENRALLGARFAWVLTRQLDGAAVELADRYSRSGIRLIWILCRGVGAQDAEPEPLVDELKKRQIPVLTVYPGDDLAQVMAGLV